MAESKDLRKRLFTDLVQFATMLALLVFLPAWSLVYWQGWLFLSTFVVAVVCISGFFLKRDPALIERRLRAGSGAEKQRVHQVFQALANLFFIALVVVPGLDHRFVWSHQAAWLPWLGEGLIVLGFLLVFRVFRENTYTSATIEIAEEQRVVSTGPYRFVRHPMYVGALLITLGIPLTLGSLWGLFLWLPMFVAIVVRLVNEEKYLKEELPGYGDYMRQTRYRLIPWVY